MIRYKAISIAASAAMLLSSLSVSAEDMPNRKRVNAPYGEAVIDGMMDECYKNAASIITEIPSDQNIIDDGAKAVTRVVWDYTGLNIYAEIKDSTPDVTGAYPYLRDSFEIFMDEDLSRSVIKDNNDVQYRVGMNNEHSIGLKAEDNYTSAVQTTENGYNVEVHIPWRDYFPFENSIIGFDVMVNDASGGERKSMMMWNADWNSNYNDTSRYGELQLIYGDNYKAWNKIDPLKVVINKQVVACDDAPPVIENDITLVPLRAIVERLNAGVAWNNSERAVYIICRNKEIKLIIDSNTADIDDKKIKLDAPARIINGRTMVPLRFILESIGAEVEFDDYIGAVVISDTEIE